MMRSRYSLGLLIAALAVVPTAGVLADPIVVTNPNFATDTIGWSSVLDYGVAGQNDPTTNPWGSLVLMYAQSGGITGTDAPAGTAGGFTLDANQIPTPAGSPPATSVVSYFSGGTECRITSLGGGLGSFYQDTTVQFAANTQYTLSAYACGYSTGYANTGVGLSGSSPLTLSQIVADPNLKDWGQSPGAQWDNPNQMVLRTVVVDTSLPAYAGLVGQNIIVNLLSNSDSYYGRNNRFSGVTLTATTVPEPGTMALLAFGSLAVLHRRGKKA